MDSYSDLHSLIGNYLDYDKGQEVSSFNTFTAKDLDFLDEVEGCTIDDTESPLLSPSSTHNFEHYLEKKLIHHIVEEQIVHLYDDTDWQCCQEWPNYSTSKAFSPRQLSCRYCDFKCPSSTELKYHQVHCHQSQPQVTPATSDIAVLSYGTFHPTSHCDCCCVRKGCPCNDCSCGDHFH